MLHRRLIVAAHRRYFTLEVMAQITGVPARLIAAYVQPHPTKIDLYSLKHVEAFLESETGQRRLRKLRQNQLEIYRDCQATWRDAFGTVHQAASCVVKVRGKRLEMTLDNCHRIIQRADDPAVAFKGTKLD